MDIGFEIGKKLNLLALNAALIRQNKETLWIHFDEKDPFNFKTPLVPIIENIAYVLTCFNHKTQDSFQAGQKRLQQILALHQGGNFPKYLHQFPDFESPYIGLLVFPYLYKISKNFAPYLNKEILSQVDLVLEEIRKKTDQVTLYNQIEPLAAFIRNKQVGALNESWESGLAFSLIDSTVLNLSLQPYGKYLENGHLMLSYLDFIKGDHFKKYSPDLLKDHPMHLKLSLFYEPFIKKNYPDELFTSKTFKDGLNWKDDFDAGHVLSWDEKAHKLSHSQTEICLKGKLDLHEALGIYFPKNMVVTQKGLKGTYFIKNIPILVEGHDKSFVITSDHNMGLVKEKRPKELFDEPSLSLKILSSGDYNLTINQS